MLDRVFWGTFIRYKSWMTCLEGSTLITLQPAFMQLKITCVGVTHISQFFSTCWRLVLARCTWTKCMIKRQTNSEEFLAQPFKSWIGALKGLTCGCASHTDQTEQCICHDMNNDCPQLPDNTWDVFFYFAPMAMTIHVWTQNLLDLGVDACACVDLQCFQDATSTANTLMKMIQ